jgi:hypothetical protein
MTASLPAPVRLPTARFGDGTEKAAATLLGIDVADTIDCAR